MIDTETVFILGSGSSKPYNFPTDPELRKIIIQKFREDYLSIPYTSDFSQNAKRFYEGVRKEEVNEFIERLRDTEGVATIDEFIDVNSKYELIGKIAIQYYLLIHEREYIKKRELNYDKDWFEILLNVMLKECKAYKNPSLMDSNNVNFITFNYDRLIEYLFVKQFVGLFKELLNTNINKHQIGFFIYKIIHVYGSIGHLPPREETDSPTEVEFGEEITTYERIKETMSNIRLIKDGFNHYDRIEKKIYNAKEIYFLGVGYIENNMMMLDLERNLNFDDPPQIYGTALNKSGREISEIKSHYFNFSKKIPEPIIEPLNCNELLENYF